MTLNHGLMLVEFGALTLSELIYKASHAPAQMLGLARKGHLGVGADADIVVIDRERKCAAHLLVAGQLVMTEGLVIGRLVRPDDCQTASPPSRRTAYPTID